MRKNKRNSGITLIALVITIIVLLILAGVTIVTLTGDNGILTKSVEASENTKKANAEEQVKLAVQASIGKDGKINYDDLNDELRKINNLTYKSSLISGTNKILSLPDTVNVDGYDVTINGDGNIGTNIKEYTEDGIPIPKGFYYVGGTKNAGVVISDKEGDDLYNSAEGNQYVWIPIDGILGEDGKIEDVTGSEKKILLGRYSFDENGIPSEYSGSYEEENSRDKESLLNYGNTIANDIEGFIDSVEKNGGYYIARFEASQSLKDKAESKYNKTVWTNITQPNASEACQNLYNTVNSDLMNGYGWDTAILFIQKYSGCTDYSRQANLNSLKQLTGLSGDVQLNIYDMASNCREWSTETCRNSRIPCAVRGVSYDNSITYVSRRDSASPTDAYDNHSFRTLLYL